MNPKTLDSLFYFLDTNFWDRPWLIVLFCVTIFFILITRYFFTAVLYKNFLSRVMKFTISNGTKTQLRREVQWSIISSLIFTVLAVGSFYLFQQGHTKIYTELADRSISYFVISIPLLLFLYESYYYWLHRWMHQPKVFKIVHKLHHQSIHPTVFTSFAFHPLEAILQFIFLPVVIMIVPIHYYALGAVLTIMTVSAVINHAGVEIFPKNFVKHPIGKWLIGSTHHDLHHHEFRSNYGLYLTIWDKWMKTENENFEKQFDVNKRAITQSQSRHHQSAGDQRK
jgi:Delta7-sterol 5-desaturase